MGPIWGSVSHPKTLQNVDCRQIIFIKQRNKQFYLKEPMKSLKYLLSRTIKFCTNFNEIYQDF